MKQYFENIYNKSKNEYYEKLNNYLDTNTKKFIITANPETLMLASKNSDLNKALIDKSNDIIADGIAIVKSAKHYKVNIKERITGFDTAVKLLELANQKKKNIYLFGAKQEVLDKLQKEIKIKYPKIKIIGATNGYVKDKNKVFDEITKLSPDICFVALGIPVQEELIINNIEKVDKGIYIGVGGSFDVLSGTKKRAPKILIKLNLEWLYRIIKEPKRIKRFYQNNIKFIFKVFFERN